MECKMCDALVACYNRSVHVFVNAVLTFREAQGDDSAMSVEEADRLQLKFTDASRALTLHWRNEHPDLSQKESLTTRT
jgi:hypothetical protein